MGKIPWPIRISEITRERLQIVARETVEVSLKLGEFPPMRKPWHLGVKSDFACTNLPVNCESYDSFLENSFFSQILNTDLRFRIRENVLYRSRFEFQH